MNNPALICQAYAFATVVLWSTAYVYTKVALAFFTPGPLGLVRCAVASLAFVGILLARGRARGGFFVPSARHLPLFAAAGLSGFTLYLLAFNEGSITLNPTTNCIVISTAPILTAALARLFFSERLPVLRWLALALAFGGVVVMNGGGQGFMLAPGMQYGDAWREALSRFRQTMDCPDCHGARLNTNALSVRVDDLNIAQFCNLSVERALEWLEKREFTGRHGRAA